MAAPCGGGHRTATPGGSVQPPPGLAHRKARLGSTRHPPAPASRDGPPDGVRACGPSARADPGAARGGTWRGSGDGPAHALLSVPAGAGKFAGERQGDKRRRGPGPHAAAPAPRGQRALPWTPRPCRRAGSASRGVPEGAARAALRRRAPHGAACGRACAWVSTRRKPVAPKTCRTES